MKSRRQRLALEWLEDRTLMSICHVNSLNDLGVGDGFRGDLRYCINKANAEPGEDVIDFNVTGTIELEAALPIIVDDVVMVGSGASDLAIDANGFGRVLDVNGGVNAQIYRVTMTGGFEKHGGGLRNFGTVTLADVVIDANRSPSGNGGGIFNSGNLQIYGSAITDNKISFADGVARGGGIYNDGVAAIFNSTISNNVSDGQGSLALGGGIYNKNVMTIESSSVINNHARFGTGGGIYNQAEMALHEVIVQENRASSAAGILNVQGSMTFENGTISNNIAANIGGGLENGGPGVAIFRNSTIANNVALLGGGIHNSGNLTLHNSTVAMNTANRSGGGIGNLGSLVLTHSTISGNSASFAGGGVHSSEISSSLHVRNTIVADNLSRPDLGPDVKGFLTSSSYNLFGNGIFVIGTSPTDILNVDPMLGPLQDNGGPTQTMALLPGSPAIDAGDNTDAPEFDQRGPGFRGS